MAVGFLALLLVTTHFVTREEDLQGCRDTGFLRQITLSSLPLPHACIKLELTSSWSWKGRATGAWTVFEAINVRVTNNVLHSLTY